MGEEEISFYDDEEGESYYEDDEQSAGEVSQPPKLIPINQPSKKQQELESESIDSDELE